MFNLILKDVFDCTLRIKDKGSFYSILIYDFTLYRKNQHDNSD